MSRPRAKNARFLVIGGGASGIMAALELKELGYSNITLIEKEDQVGGQCKTFYPGEELYKGTQQNGCATTPKVWELGAAMITSRRLVTLLRENDLSVLRAGRPPVAHDLDTGEVRDTWRDVPTGEKLRFLFHLYKNRQRLSHPTRNHCPPEMAVPAKDWFHNNRMKAFGDYYAATQPCTTDTDLKGVFPAWLTLHEFSLTPVTMMVPKFCFVKEGFQQLWIRLAKKLPDVRTNTTIDRIVRSADSLTLLTRDRGEEVFDVLVVSLPLQTLKNFTNVTPAEQDLFEKISSTVCINTILRIKGLAHRGVNWAYIPQNNSCPDRFSRPLGYVCHESHKDIFLIHHVTDGTVSIDDIHKYDREDMQRLGAEVTEVLHVNQWDIHNSHFPVEEIKRGIYDKIDRLQGEMNTYYTGEVLAAHSVGSCVSFSEYTMNRFFAHRVIG